MKTEEFKQLLIQQCFAESSNNSKIVYVQLNADKSIELIVSLDRYPLVLCTAQIVGSTTHVNGEFTINQYTEAKNYGIDTLALIFSKMIAELDMI